MRAEGIRRWLDTLGAPKIAKSTALTEPAKTISNAQVQCRRPARSCPELSPAPQRNFQNKGSSKRKRTVSCIDSEASPQACKRRCGEHSSRGAEACQQPYSPRPLKNHYQTPYRKTSCSFPIPSPANTNELKDMDGRLPPVLQSYPSAPSPGASQSSFTGLTPSSSSRDKRSRKRKGTEGLESTTTVDKASSSYRSGVLLPNNVIVCGPRDPLALDVQEQMRQTLDKSRDSPGLDAGQLHDLTVIIQEAAIASEAQLQRVTTEAFFFKPQNARSSVTEQLPFHPDSVPQAPIEVRKAVPRIPAPIPDITYGYAINAIPNGGYLHSAKIHNTPTRPYFKPVTDVAQPYLVVEFKDVKDTIWAATNQAVGGGSASVKAAEVLKQLANNGVRLNEPATTMAYSAVVYGSYATLHIQWSEYDMQKSWSDRERYYAKQVATYDLARPETASEFRQHIRNIVDWGLDERFEYQKGWTKALVDAWISELAATGRAPRDETERSL